MARTITRLNSRTVTTSKPGIHADGNGLYLKVETTGARRWVFVFFQNGRRREMGLGSLADVPLSTAREQTQEARRQVAAGQSPIIARQSLRAADKAVLFGDLADQVVDALAP